jgi:hypothetical protein
MPSGTNQDRNWKLKLLLRVYQSSRCLLELGQWPAFLKNDLKHSPKLSHSFDIGEWYSTQGR